MPSYRILRCANAQLYIGATLIVLISAIYVLCCKDTLWQQILAIGAAAVTPIWAAYYARLRYTVNETGITRHSLTGTTQLRWAELTAASVQEKQNQGTASCTIHLQAGSVCMDISSELLPLDDVQELAEELRKIGLIH